MAWFWKQGLPPPGSSRVGSPRVQSAPQGKCVGGTGGGRRRCAGSGHSTLAMLLPGEVVTLLQDYVRQLVTEQKGVCSPAGFWQRSGPPAVRS